MTTYRRTGALLVNLFGRDMGKRETFWMLVLTQVGGIAVGVGAYLALPAPALIVFVGLLVAAVIWFLAAARAYSKSPR